MSKSSFHFPSPKYAFKTSSGLNTLILIKSRSALIGSTASSACVSDSCSIPVSCSVSFSAPCATNEYILVTLIIAANIHTLIRFLIHVSSNFICFIVMLLRFPLLLFYCITVYYKKTIRRIYDSFYINPTYFLIFYNDSNLSYLFLVFILDTRP